MDPYLALSALNSHFSLQTTLVTVRTSLTFIVRAVFLLFSKDFSFLLLEHVAVLLKRRHSSPDDLLILFDDLFRILHTSEGSFYLPNGQKWFNSHLVHAVPFLPEDLGKRLTCSAVKCMMWKLCFGTRIFRRIYSWRVNPGRTWQGRHVEKHFYRIRMFCSVCFLIFSTCYVERQNFLIREGNSVVEKNCSDQKPCLYIWCSSWNVECCVDDPRKPIALIS